MSRWYILFVLWLLALGGADAMAAPSCITSINELRNVLEFVKAKEGLWAEGSGAVCCVACWGRVANSH